MAGDLEGKVALISGAARGMGAEEARLFVAEGARVLLGDVLDEEGEKTAAALGDAVIYQRLDVTDEASWQSAVAKAESVFGKLDVLVNNAGVLGFGPIETTTREEYERVIRVNQIGPFLGMKSAIPALRRAGGGSIVNISSLAGMVGLAGAVSYVSSKFAVRGMTKVAALELGRDGIRVNSVHPGGVETPMTRPLGDRTDDAPAREYRTPIARIGRPDEIAQMVLFLASDKSSYCTGAEFIVDGGDLAGQVHESLTQ